MGLLNSDKCFNWHYNYESPGALQSVKVNDEIAEISKSFQSVISSQMHFSDLETYMAKNGRAHEEACERIINSPLHQKLPEIKTQEL